MRRYYNNIREADGTAENIEINVEENVYCRWDQ